jgi:hypothetical protein
MYSRTRLAGKEAAMSFVTLWTLDRTECVLAVDRAKRRYDLQIIDDDVVLLEQLNLSVDDVVATALSWQCQYASPGFTLAGRAQEEALR